MLAIYYAVAIVALVAVVGVGLLLKFKAPAKLNILFKTVSLILATALFVRYMTGHDNLEYIKFLQVSNGFTAKGWIMLALFQVWFAYAVELLVILASFFKARSLPALVTFFGGVVFVLNFAFLNNHIVAITGAEALTTFNYRAMLIAVETGLGLGYVVIATLNSYKEIILKDKEWIWFALALVGMILASTPAYTLQLVLDIKQYTMNPLDLNVYHRIILYPAFLIPIGLYLLLKDSSYENKRLVMMYYAWSGLLSYLLHTRFIDFAGNGWVTSLPLHLCNTAMYVTPLCLTFKAKKVFYFTYFINVLGAFLALTMPDYGSDASIIGTSTLIFYINHYQAFFMPLLVVGLGIFRRPRWKEFKYSVIGFAVYFVLMLVINAWFSNYNENVDYFFLNSDFIADKFGNGGRNLRNIVWEFDIANLHFKFYPLYQALFFTVYLAASFVMWFIYELGYNVVQGWLDVAARNKKVKVDRLALEVKLAGRSIEEPMNMENTNKLILKNFTKRYGTSDVYAVKDACLEVNGGEIFGFLGPNGAGKSTIIKSIVGIQTITDGAIEVCGYDVSTQSVQAKRQIGFVPDHYALYERLTAREYINYIADLYDVSQEDRTERLNHFIELFEFQSAIDTPIKTYSHGMKQKVTIMAALIHNPKVWILDEPLTGLDPNSIFQVKECMKRHAEEGNIVFFSSHIIDVVERICDRIAIIRKGQIQCVRDVHEMEAADESLEAYYMSVINGHEVNPIAVEGASGDKAEAKTTKRKWFSKKSASDKEKKQ